MKSMVKYATVCVTVFAMFLISAMVADWVLSWSGCIWSSSAFFGINFVTQLGMLSYVWHSVWDLLQGW